MPAPAPGFVATMATMAAVLVDIQSVAQARPQGAGASTPAAIGVMRAALDAHRAKVQAALAAVSMPITADESLSPGLVLPAGVAEEMRSAVHSFTAWYAEKLGMLDTAIGHAQAVARQVN